MGEISEENRPQAIYGENRMEEPWTMDAVKQALDLKRGRTSENTSDGFVPARRRVASPAPRAAPAVVQALPGKLAQETPSHEDAPAPPARPARGRAASPAPRASGQGAEGAPAAVAADGTAAPPSLVRRALRAVGWWGLVPFLAAAAVLMDPLGPQVYPGGYACGCKEPRGGRLANPCVEGDRGDAHWCMVAHPSRWRECQYSCR